IAAVLVWVKPTWAIAMVAIGAGVFCIAGLIWRSLSATLTGCVLVTINLAAALWSSGGSLSVFGAIAFGLALLHLLECTHFAERFAGAEIDRSAWHAQTTWWIRRAAICIAAGVAPRPAGSLPFVVIPRFRRPAV